MSKEHTLLKDGEGNIIKPFTDDEVVSTKMGRSKLSTDLATIETHMKGVLDGSILVNHAMKAGRFDSERTIQFTGDMEGSYQFDGSQNVKVPVKIAGNSHEHPMDKITGLTEALNEKANVVHEHSEYESFQHLNVVTPKGATMLVSGKGKRDFTLEAGSNIILEPNEATRTIRVRAIMEGASAASSESANTVKGVRLDTDANRSANERYLVTGTYGQHTIIGRGLNFHYAGSEKEFDGQLTLNLAKQLTWQLDGELPGVVFHSEHMGHHSTLDADLLDGRHGHEYSLNGHEHEEYISKGEGGVLSQDLVLENNVAIQGKENDDFTQHPLLLVNGLNQAVVGSTGLPLRLRHNGDIECEDLDGNVTNIFHGGNLPGWDDIVGKPSTFTPSSHRHGLDTLDNVASENAGNTLVKRDESGNSSFNKVTVESLQAGDGFDSNITKSLLDSYHLRFSAKTFNYIQAENELGSLVFLTNGNLSHKVLHLTKEGNGVFGRHLEVTEDLSVGGASTFYGATTLNSTLHVKGHTTLGGNLSVSGTTTTQHLNVSGALTQGGAATFNGAVRLWSSFTTSDNAYFDNNKGIAMKNTGGSDFWALYVGTDNKVRVGDSGLDMEIRASVNPKVKVGATVYTLYHTGNKPTPDEIGALPTNHASASFGYNGSTGRITHNGNDVRVANSVNAERATNADKAANADRATNATNADRATNATNADSASWAANSGKWAGYTVWAGHENSRPTGAGYIAFCTA